MNKSFNNRRKSTMGGNGQGWVDASRLVLFDSRLYLDLRDYTYLSPERKRSSDVLIRESSGQGKHAYISADDLHKINAHPEPKHAKDYYYIYPLASVTISYPGRPVEVLRCTDRSRGLKIPADMIPITLSETAESAAERGELQIAAPREWLRLHEGQLGILDAPMPSSEMLTKMDTIELDYSLPGVGATLSVDRLAELDEWTKNDEHPFLPIRQWIMED